MIRSRLSGSTYAFDVDFSLFQVIKDVTGFNARKVVQKKKLGRGNEGKKLERERERKKERKERRKSAQSDLSKVFFFYVAVQ
jgi:hypothetical protein